MQSIHDTLPGLQVGAPTHDCIETSEIRADRRVTTSKREGRDTSSQNRLASKTHTQFRKE